MINAAESMPSGGTVTISFENTTLESPDSILTPGEYIDIAISDQGNGIPDENYCYSKYRQRDANALMNFFKIQNGLFQTRFQLNGRTPTKFLLRI